MYVGHTGMYFGHTDVYVGRTYMCLGNTHMCLGHTHVFPVHTYVTGTHIYVSETHIFVWDTHTYVGHTQASGTCHNSGSRSPFYTLTSALDIIFQAASIEHGFRASFLSNNTVLDIKKPLTNQKT